MKIKTGTYTGNGADNRTITIRASWGNPDFVFIVCDAAFEGVWKTSDMAGDTSFLIANIGALTANLIQAFGDGTFQIGSDSKVNNNGDEYYYIAIQDTGDGEFDVETYTGTGDNTGLTKDFNCSYTPDLCFIHGDDSSMYTFIANGDMPADGIYDFNGSLHTNKLTGFVADGFTIKNHSKVNTSGETYYCIIAKEVNGIINGGTYTGNVTDDRDITVTGYSGITGDCVWVYGAGREGNMLTTDMGADNTCPMLSGVAAVDRIQTIHSGGFQIGAANACNYNGVSFYYTLFKDYSAGTTVQAVAADGIKTTDATLRSKTVHATATDGFNSSDSSGNIAALQAILGDGVKFQELINVIANLQALSVDGTELSDVTTGAIKKIVTAIDGIDLSDITSTVANLTATSTDEITLTDIVAVIKTALATATDGVEFSDVSIGEVLGAIVAIVSDGVTFTDAALSRADLLATASDGVVFSEVVSSFLTSIATASDGITLTDTVTAAVSAAIQALAADGINLSDSAIEALTIFALAADSIIMTDAGIPLATFRVTAADSVQFSEAINTIFHFVATVTDGFTVSDTTIELSMAADGNVNICITSKSSSILFTVMKPVVSIEPKRATIKITKQE